MDLKVEKEYRQVARGPRWWTHEASHGKTDLKIFVIGRFSHGMPLIRWAQTWLDPLHMKLLVSQHQTCPLSEGSTSHADKPGHKSWNKMPWSLRPNCSHETESAYNLLSPPERGKYLLWMCMDTSECVYMYYSSVADSWTSLHNWASSVAELAHQNHIGCHVAFYNVWPYVILEVKDVYQIEAVRNY